MYKWKGKNEFPSVITIFSAPNYCVIKFEVNQIIFIYFKVKYIEYLII